MQNWKRTLMNAGVSLTVVGAGALVAEGAASAHDAVDHDGVAHHVQGVVTAVGTDSFTISNHRGTETIDTTTTTTFAESGTPVAPTTVAVGQTVVASLDPTDTTPTAVRVTVLLNRLSGKVITVTGSSITLSGPRGTTRQALLSPTTMVFSGKTTATSVTVGEFVTVFGTRDATTPTELDASFIDIASNVPGPVHGPAVNPNRGPGHDDHGDNDGAPVTTTPPTTAVTPPTTPGTEPEPEPGDPDHNGAPGNDDHGDRDGNGGPGNQADNDNDNGGGEGGSGSGSSGGGHGSGGHSGGH